MIINFHNFKIFETIKDKVNPTKRIGGIDKPKNQRRKHINEENNATYNRI